MRRRVRLVQGLPEQAARPVALASCRSGEHAIWWDVEAASDRDALALLPFYVAERTTATVVSEVQIP